VKDVTIGSRVFFSMCGVKLNAGVIEHTYSSFITIAHHGVRLLVNLDFVSPFMNLIM
jgi:hypothetical protein